ncbi:hypothetical protein [Actinomadura rudentiformis]|uniref:Uncharacterized protein n=1 Tax=Actinomadura rudentiformis TaxID=359158 RepID=A0A6H9YI14_9ACTN|nr:hypothetical protein [Actinomadura rudentiformis]KAB2344837.1 hypothetical protein F8566_30055 [Actinomadura rudentiformis]
MMDDRHGASPFDTTVSSVLAAFRSSTNALGGSPTGGRSQAIRYSAEGDVAMVAYSGRLLFGEVRHSSVTQMLAALREAQDLRGRLKMTLASELGHSSLAAHEAAHVLLAPTGNGKSALVDALRVCDDRGFVLVDETHRTTSSLLQSEDVLPLATTFLAAGAGAVVARNSALRLRISAAHAEVLIGALNRLLTVLALLVLLAALTYAVVRRGFSLRVIAVSMRHRHRREPADGSFLFADRIQQSMAGVPAVH